MRIAPRRLAGTFEIALEPRGDERGYFMRWYDREAFARAWLPVDWLQGNQSASRANVVRGLHFQRAPIPEAFRPLGSLAFSKLLLEHAKVAVAPGIGFGEYGDGHVRIALVENEQRIRQAARTVRKFLAQWPSIIEAQAARNAVQ